MSINDTKRKLSPSIGDKLTCPVCNKKFTVDENTNYIVKGGYVCDWKCFKKRMKDTEAERKAKDNKK